MTIRSLTDQQSVFKRYYSDKHFSQEFLPTRWRQKSTGENMEQNYITVTLCIYSICYVLCYQVDRYSSVYRLLFSCYCSLGFDD